MVHHDEKKNQFTNERGIVDGRWNCALSAKLDKRKQGIPMNETMNHCKYHQTSILLRWNRLVPSIQQPWHFSEEGALQSWGWWLSTKVKQVEQSFKLLSSCVLYFLSLRKGMTLWYDTEKASWHFMTEMLSIVSIEQADVIGISCHHQRVSPPVPTQKAPNLGRTVDTPIPPSAN